MNKNQDTFQNPQTGTCASAYRDSSPVFFTGHLPRRLADLYAFCASQHEKLAIIYANIRV